MNNNYRKYLQSDTWQKTREKAIEQADHRCELCGYGNGILNVHHLSYERIGCEEPRDLRVLCKPCHARQHPEKLDGGHWSWIAKEQCKLCPSILARLAMAGDRHVSVMCVGCNHEIIRRTRRTADHDRTFTDGESCADCDKTFANIYDLSQHLRDKHGMMWEEMPYVNDGGRDTSTSESADDIHDDGIDYWWRRSFDGILSAR